jgi:hypothetical protein
MTNYVLRVSDHISNHIIFGSLGKKTKLLHDFAADLSRDDIDAIVASGDYFGTLATSLDSISQRLLINDNGINEPEHYNLEKIINALLYIETKYSIVKR